MSEISWKCIENMWIFCSDACDDIATSLVKYKKVERERVFNIDKDIYKLYSNIDSNFIFQCLVSKYI